MTYYDWETEITHTANSLVGQLESANKSPGTGTYERAVKIVAMRRNDFLKKLMKAKKSGEEQRLLIDELEQAIQERWKAASSGPTPRYGLDQFRLDIDAFIDNHS